MSGRERVASLTEIPPGTVRAVQLGEEEIVLCNAGGTLYAVNDICTHGQANLHEGELYEDTVEIECPLHGATFDLRTGRPTCLPAVVPLKTYTVAVEDGEVYLTVE